MFLPQVYKANPSHVLEVAHIVVCVNLCEICEELSFTQAQGYQEEIRSRT